MRQSTTAILNYNDFNDTERESKANAIASMVKEFNERYAAESAAGRGRVLLDAAGNPRPLVDVIGTQGHLDMRLNLDDFERTIRTYLDLGVSVDLTELDVAPSLALDKSQRIPNGSEMNDIFMAQGVYYAKLFNLLKEYAAGPGGLLVISPQGKVLGTLKFSEQPANLAWGDDDRQTLYVTARTGLYRVRLSVPGARIAEVSP
jgi:hypothetical protein